MNILVLGGSGFLGSHVADQLTFAEHNVRIFDRIPSPWLLPKQKMIMGDLLDQTALEEAIEGCEAVYNFAAISDLDEAFDKPLETARINVLGNVQILEACRKAGVKRYVYASTVYVYSREGGFYRCSKQAAEQYVEEYQSRYGLDYTILRYGSLYGTRTDKRNGVWRIIERALKTGQVNYEGNSESMREYIHVEDAARASVHILDAEYSNQHIVLTGFQQMRVLDLLKMIAEILNLPEQAVKFIPTDKLSHYVRSPYAYQPKLGRKYTPPLHIDLGQGMLQMIEEIKSSKSTG